MTIREVLIGLDVGTTRVKAVAVGLDGRELAEAECPTPWHTDADGTWAAPADLAAAVRAAVVGVVADPALTTGGPVRVLGVGATGMAEAGVLLDAADRPLAPVLAWHDRRGDTATIRDRIGVDTFHATVGMLLDPKPSLPKILWLRAHVPGADAAVRFLSVPEWAVRCLGGAPVSELSLASRTGLLDVAAGTAWDQASDLLGTCLLNELVSAGTAVGRVTGDGLPHALRGAVLTVAGHDHQTAAFAVGAARPDALLDSLGTAEALVRCVAGPLPPDVVRTLAEQDVSCGWTVVPGHYSVLQGVLTGLTLERVAALLGATIRPARAELGEAACRVDPPAGVALTEAGDGEFVLGPLVDGLSPAAVWAVAVRDLVAVSTGAVERIDRAVGAHRDVVIAGGWLRNPAVRAAKSRQFPGHRTSPLEEAGAVGAAFFAGVAAGVLARPEPDEVPRWHTRTPVRPRSDARPTSATAVPPHIQTESLIVTKDNESDPNVSQYIYKSNC